MSKWRWNHQTGESYEVKDDGSRPPPRAPMIMKSRGAYKSPITGEKIYGRKGREFDLNQHGCADHRDVPDGDVMAKEKEVAQDKAIEDAFDYVADHIEQQ